MPTSSPRLKSGNIPKNRDFSEQYWSYTAVISGRACQRYMGVAGGGFLRPYPASDLLKENGYWRWHHPGRWRQRVLFSAGVAKTISVVCLCTTDLTPRPAIRLLSNTAIGIVEQVATLPSGLNIERTLTLTATASSNGVAWLQLEWLAMIDGRQSDYVGWKSVGAN